MRLLLLLVSVGDSFLNFAKQGVQICFHMLRKILRSPFAKQFTGLFGSLRSNPLNEV